MLAAALALALRGFAVFPCVPGGKVPATAHGFKDATTDAAIIAGCWAELPAANIGIACGASGLVVLDLDRKDGRDGVRTLWQVECDLDRVPRTLSATTPSGGLHLYYRAPRDVEIRNGQSTVCERGDAPGLDVRGVGGYVVAPPSFMAAGRYAWRDDLPIADVPQPWVDALARERAPDEPPAPVWTPRSYSEADRVALYVHRAIEGELRKVADAPHGTRSDRLLASARALGGLVHTGATDALEVRDALLGACASWPRFERDPHKDRDTIERGIAYGLAAPREVRP